MIAVEDEIEQRYDRLGRRLPRRLPMTHFIELAVRSKPDRLREVPRRAVADDGVDDDGHFAMVECPCGGKPIVRYPIEKCGGCERYYVLVAPTVFVLYGDMALPGAEAPASS